MSEKNSSNPIGKALVVVLIIGGGWMFLRKYEIQGLDHLQVKPRTGSSDSAGIGAGGAAGADPIDAYFASGIGEAQSALLAAAEGVPSHFAATRLTAGPRQADQSAGAQSASALTGDGAAHARQQPVRVGSWALAGFGRDKLAKPHVMDLFSRVVRGFDVIALQQITSTERDLLPRIVEHVNRTGRRYDFLLGPVVGPVGEEGQGLGEQYAFLFDAQRIETDRGQLYTLADPGQQVSYDPLVGWFRVREVPVPRAWTFTIVNFRVDSLRADQEVPLVGQIMGAVAADGRSEDDLLLAGMLQADDRELTGYLGGEACQAAVRATPTDIFARYQLSNLISPKETATEYLGRGGVVDFLRLYNLSTAECEELTPHLPVYAEFTPTEGN